MAAPSHCCTGTVRRYPRGGEGGGQGTVPGTATKRSHYQGSDLQGAEDTGVLHTPVRGQLTEAPPEDVQVPKDLSKEETDRVPISSHCRHFS